MSLRGKRRRILGAALLLGAGGGITPVIKSHHWLRELLTLTPALSLGGRRGNRGTSLTQGGGSRRGEPYPGLLSTALTGQ